MKTLFKAIAVASLATATVAQAEVSLTGGAVSDYYFRGVQLAESSAYASIDYSAGGFYAGVWAIDNNSQLERDLYVGYATTVGDVGVDVSYTNYSYSDQGDNNETDLTLAITFAGLGLSYADVSGEDAAGNDTADSSVITANYNIGNFNLLVGQLDSDAANLDYNWVEVSTSADVAGLTAALTVGGQFGVDADNGNDGYIVLDLSKSFDL
ncbi:TorF family putative porin [Pseudomonadales bacterium]|nr:TorF family putative porin [Pseudomonadales bacterium]